MSSNPLPTRILIYVSSLLLACLATVTMAAHVSDPEGLNSPDRIFTSHLHVARAESETKVCGPTEGNPDMYGRGIRISIYMQIGTTILVHLWQHKLAPGISAVNNWFFIAFTAAIFGIVRDVNLGAHNVLQLKLELYFLQAMGSLILVVTIYPELLCCVCNFIGGMVKLKDRRVLEYKAARFDTLATRTGYAIVMFVWATGIMKISRLRTRIYQEIDAGVLGEECIISMCVFSGDEYEETRDFKKPGVSVTVTWIISFVVGGILILRVFFHLAHVLHVILHHLDIHTATGSNPNVEWPNKVRIILDHIFVIPAQDIRLGTLFKRKNPNKDPYRAHREYLVQQYEKIGHDQPTTGGPSSAGDKGESVTAGKGGGMSATLSVSTRGSPDIEKHDAITKREDATGGLEAAGEKQATLSSDVNTHDANNKETYGNYQRAFSVMCILGMIILSALQGKIIECSLKRNQIQGVSEINSPGQLIPLILAVGNVATFAFQVFIGERRESFSEKGKKARKNWWRELRRILTKWSSRA